MFKIKNFSIVPKFVILLLDLGATVTALFIAILIQQNVALRAINWDHVVNSIFLILLINSLVFTTTKSYTGIVRYTGVQDAVRIAVAVAISSFIILGMSKVTVRIIGSPRARVLTVKKFAYQQAELFIPIPYFEIPFLLAGGIAGVKALSISFV